MSALGGLLHAHRRRRGLSQEELASQVQPTLSVNTIANLERGRTRPHRGTAESLCDALALGADERAELLAAWRVAGGADPAPAALGVTTARPHNLPAPLTSFVGREQELARVAGLLAGTRLLTLT